jgi:hypothetical protein
VAVMAFGTARKRRPSTRRYRCTGCGRYRVTDRLNLDPLPCPDHPAAELVEWTTGRARAMDYVTRAGRQPLTAFEDDPHTAKNYWPGVAYIDLWDCLRWREAWEWFEAEPLRLGRLFA